MRALMGFKRVWDTGLWVAPILMVAACEQPKPAQRTASLETSGEALHTPAVRHVIQVGAFHDLEKAHRAVLALQNAGLPAFLSLAGELSEKAIYRVRLGPFMDEVEAGSALDKAQAHGYPDAFHLKISHSSATDSLVASLSETTESPSDTIEPPSEPREAPLVSTGYCQNPLWSPTNREIAFYGRIDNATGIFTIGTGGGHVSRIVRSTATLRIFPKFAWSPNGERLAFVASSKSASGKEVESLYIVDKDGMDLRRLFTESISPSALQNLTWSRDGKYIACEVVYQLPRANGLRFQEIKVASLEGDLLEAPGRHLNQRLAGWQSPHKLIYLQTNPRAGEANRAHEIRSLDLQTGKSNRIGQVLLPETCTQVAYRPEPQRLLYATVEEAANEPGSSHRLRILAVDLKSGRGNLLIEGQTESYPGVPFVVCRNGEVFAWTGGQVWVLRQDVKPALVVEGLPPTSFTVSPSGRRICFEKSGKLFVVKRTEKNKAE